MRGMPVMSGEARRAGAVAISRVMRMARRGLFTALVLPLYQNDHLQQAVIRDTLRRIWNAAVNGVANPSARPGVAKRKPGKLCRANAIILLEMK
jgi:hypothetical protein